MSTVINLPQGQSIAGSLGNTLGSIIAQQGAATMAAMEAARFQKIQNSIASAPDRNTAIAIATQLPFKNMGEFEHTMKYMDQYHPQSEAATVDFKSFDDRGNEVTTAMARGDTKRFGPQVKRQQEEVYQLNPTTGKYESYGKNIASNIDSSQTTPGASALDNMAADNRRADQTATHANSNEDRLKQQAAFSQQQTGLNNYARELFINLGGKPHMGPGGTMMLDAESLPYDKLQAYREGLAKGGDLMQQYGNDYGKAVNAYITSAPIAKSVITQPPVVETPKVEPKPGIIKRGMDAVTNMFKSDVKPNVTTNDAKLPADHAPMGTHNPATADAFGKVRANIKGVPLRVEPNVTEDPHNPTIFYPKTGADMKDIPDGGTYLNPADGKHYVKAASVAPPVVQTIQTSGKKGEVAPNLQGGTETGKLLGPLDIDKEIKIAPGVFGPDGKIKDVGKAVQEIERLRGVMDRFYVEKDSKNSDRYDTKDFNKILNAITSMSVPLGEDEVKPTKPESKSISKPTPTITVGPPLPRKPNGDFLMSPIPKDGKFYQNVIYIDGEDTFVVDANGNRKSIDDIFNGKVKQ